MKMRPTERRFMGMARQYRGRFLKQLISGLLTCGSHVQIGAFILMLIVWVLLVLSCGDLFDGDCWMGERVHLVERSTLGEHYDPEVAKKAIFVYDFAGVRSLKFGSLKNARQSTAVLGDPDIFTMPIACHMAATILVMCPAPPARVLIFGMGGGMLVAFIQKHFPSAFIQIVDLEPEVVRLALAHFNVRTSRLLNVSISDGRKWVSALPPHGLPSQHRYDLIIQDACAGHPCTLVTLQSYTALRSLAMAPNALFIQNLFSPSPRVVRTMQEAFHPLYFLDSGFSSKVVMGYSSPSPLPPHTLSAAAATAAGGGGGGGDSLPTGATAAVTPPAAESAAPGGITAAAGGDAVGRARFLRDMGLSPRCFVHGLRQGQTDDSLSMFERRFAPASRPVLPAAPILDNDPEVAALERARWGPSPAAAAAAAAAAG